MRAFITTVLRESQDKGLTGYLYEVDWDNKAILKQIPIPIDSNAPFWNARGGNRGGRGMVTHDGILYVATTTSILKFDRSLNLIGDIIDERFAGLHMLAKDEEGFWVTAGVPCPE